MELVRGGQGIGVRLLGEKEVGNWLRGGEIFGLDEVRVTRWF